MKNKVLEDSVINECILTGYNQSAAASYLRSIGYRFTASAFAGRWRALTGVPKRQRRFHPPIPAAHQRASSPATAHVLVAEEPEDLPPVTRAVFGGKRYSPDEYRPTLTGTRFVFTSAQNNTGINEDFWKSLLHFCSDKGAQLGVARFSYNKNGWAKQGGQSKFDVDADDAIWYAPEIEPYIIDRQVKVCEGLVFCAELDILPTAVTPLNGLDSYTGKHSAIVPHAKMQMKSLATMKYEDAKFLYSTGACTLRNYIERRAGQIASHHHIYGAMYVEIDEEGVWFARQINADDTGVFYDLDKVYTPQGAFSAEDIGKPVITLGDIHIEKLDPTAWRATEDMLLQLQPEAVILHDLIDFEARNHHNKRDPLFLANQFYNRDQTVEGAFKLAGSFITDLNKNFPGTKVYAIRSNHDIALMQWLREGSTFIDPPNARFWHELNFKLHEALEKGYQKDMYSYAMYKSAAMSVTFIQEDESLVINGIEYGLHGHRGPNGARGNPSGYRQIGARANTGHTHSAGIIDGVWTAGVLGNLDMGYNIGPSSWSHSNIIAYPNGKRQIITIKGNKWKA